ncbi:hypothetical protein F2P56_027905 [Juglans regia]|uniref:Small ribosomal subunit protein uS3 C-terminal domain-containing protein n=1 Tax=Juglans regia TaxID=51240 RepID=A0A833UIY7_JUGRE|nr:hypothetical protein F2P56_027905 [Juglans regia]
MMVFFIYYCLAKHGHQEMLLTYGHVQNSARAHTHIYLLLPCQFLIFAFFLSFSYSGFSWRCLWDHIYMYDILNNVYSCRSCCSFFIPTHGSCTCAEFSFTFLFSGLSMVFLDLSGTVEQKDVRYAKEVIVSGELRAQHAKSMKFKDGYMISSGQPVNEYIDSAVRHVLLRQVVLGIKVKILLDWDPKGKLGPTTTPLPDLVTIHLLKEEEGYSMSASGPHWRQLI